MISVETPFTARLLVDTLLVWKALGRLILTFWPNAAFILVSLCKISTSCNESPIITKSPFQRALILETLRPGWYCLNSPISCLHVLILLSTPLIITGIVFLRLGRGQTGVSGGGSEEPFFCRVGSVGEPLALCFLRLRVTSENSSS